MAAGRMPLKIFVPAGLGGAGLFLYARHQQTGHLRVVDWVIAGSIAGLSLLLVLSSWVRTTEGWDDEEELPAFSGQRKLLLAVILMPLALWGLYQASDDFENLFKKPDERTLAARALAKALRYPRIVRTGAGEPDGTGWVPAGSSLGGFLVHVPDRFNEAIVALKVGGRLTPVVIVGSEMENLKFVALAARWGDDAKDLEARAKAAVKSLCQFEDSVVAGEGLFEDKFPWIEVEGRPSGARGLARVIATDTAIYGLAVEGPELTNPMRVAAGRFFDSFAITAPEPNETLIRDAVGLSEPNRSD
ncbi:MAG: hypothetical protein GX448_01980 [Planctomycetes bacterium]|nr:hypothetical protein [Planctomycetota bacterium]